MPYSANQKSTGLETLTNLDTGDLVIVGDISDSGRAKAITFSNLENDFTLDNLSGTLAITKGGTGATSASDARTNLGLVIGTNVQAYDAQLADVAGLTPTDNGVIIGNGANFVVETGSTLRTSLGLAIGSDVQGYDADLAAIAGLTSAANKIPMFSGSGTATTIDFKDEDNMASDSATAVPSQQSVKAYVDTNSLSTNSVPNTSAGFSTYSSSTAYPSSNTGWTMIGSTETRVANGVSVQGATNVAMHAVILGRSNHPANNVLFNSDIDFKVRGVWIPAQAPNGTAPAGAGDKWSWWGFSTSTSVSTNADITEVTTHRAGFALYGTDMYSVTCDGSSTTTNNLGAYSSITKESLMIDFTPSSVKFYRNGTLSATHSANIPTTGTMRFVSGSYDGSGTTIDHFTGTLTISETLS